MNTTTMVIGVLGDLVLCWISWRYFAKPRLEKFIRQLIRDEIKSAGHSGIGQSPREPARLPLNSAQKMAA